MNLLIFFDLTYNPFKNFQFNSLPGQNLKVFLIVTCNQGNVFLPIFTYNQGNVFLPICTYNQGKVFLILPITKGAHVYLVYNGSPPLVRMHSDVVLSSSGALLMKTVTENNRQ